SRRIATRFEKTATNAGGMVKRASLHPYLRILGPCRAPSPRLLAPPLASAQAGALRNKLFKVGAIVSISVRRIHVRLSSAFPRKQLLVQALARLIAPDTVT
ncbi:MAG: hypothetical protein GY811_10785, partial [Myxococcales bacterium]|nr:hypothetical protein [Myxococcales bacterium]